MTALEGVKIAAGEEVPLFARVRNSMRIISLDPSSEERRLAYVVKIILYDLGKVKKEEILALQDYPRRGIYDVTFIEEKSFLRFLKVMEEKKNEDRLVGFKVLPHFDQEEVVLVVKTYSPVLPLKEITAVLSQYCKRLKFGGKIWNEHGLWTSKYKFSAWFLEKKMPPARVRMGKVNIDVFFSGMPVFCRKCRSYGHVADTCEACKFCGESEHEEKNCTSPKKCNFCFETGHLYAACPVRKQKMEVVKQDVETEEEVRKVDVMERIDDETVENMDASIDIVSPERVSEKGKIGKRIVVKKEEKKQESKE
ncbi:zinc finger CCHC domain-containing protein 3-like [Xenopus laevis]|uniref:Zinc finger CCHC domain-containing protein 3-like n=1 Tax=Xenopus laevis TaxID=8355 RepID=A0A8J1LMJ0_XENLA|nr:zinc finger CCHC domain-containing protein 3-like [Xenopus laevis]